MVDDFDEHAVALVRGMPTCRCNRRFSLSRACQPQKFLPVNDGASGNLSGDVFRRPRAESGGQPTLHFGESKSPTTARIVFDGA